MASVAFWRWFLIVRLVEGGGPLEPEPVPPRVLAADRDVACRGIEGKREFHRVVFFRVDALGLQALADDFGRFVHEVETLLELLGIVRDRSAAFKEEPRIRFHVEGNCLRLGVGAARRLLVDVRGARERRKRAAASRLIRPGDARGVLELSAAERLYGVLHEIDAPRRKGPALPEVFHLHAFTHGFGNELLAAEQARDRLAEHVAHLVVRRLHVRRSCERCKRALVVAARHPRETHDGVFVFRLREIHELVVVRLDGCIYLNRHCSPLVFKLPTSNFKL